MSGALAVVPKKARRPRVEYGRGKRKISAERIRQKMRDDKTHFYKAMRCHRADMYRILPVSPAHAIVEEIIDRSVGRRQRFSEPISNAEFAAIAVCDARSVREVLPELIKRGVIEETELGSGCFRACVERWSIENEEFVETWPRPAAAKGPKSVGREKVEEPEEAEPDKEPDKAESDEGQEEAPGVPMAVRSSPRQPLLPFTQFSPGTKPREVHTGTGKLVLDIQVRSTVEVSKVGGDTYVSVQDPDKGRKEGEDVVKKTANKHTSRDSRERSLPSKEEDSPGGIIQDRLRGYGKPNIGTGDELWKRCRQAAIACDVRDVIACIDEIGTELKTGSGKKNDIAVLMTHVPLRVAEVMRARQAREAKQAEKANAKPFDEREYLRNLRKE